MWLVNSSKVDIHVTAVIARITDQVAIQLTGLCQVRRVSMVGLPAASPCLPGSPGRWAAGAARGLR